MEQGGGDRFLHLARPSFYFGRLQNRSARAMGLLPPAPVDPKLCAPQVGQTRLIWPVGVLGKAGPSVLSCRPHLWGRRLGAAAAQFKARGSVM